MVNCLFQDTFKGTVNIVPYIQQLTIRCNIYHLHQNFFNLAVIGLMILISLIHTYVLSFQKCISLLKIDNAQVL